VRPCEEYAAELRLGRARLDFEATDFSALLELDRLAVVGDCSVSACPDDFASASAETEVSGVAAGEFCVESVGEAACG
jgi:hypothetical protein